MKIQLYREIVGKEDTLIVSVFDQNGCYRIVEKQYRSKYPLGICQDFHSCPSNDYDGYTLIHDFKPHTSLFAIVAPLVTNYKQEGLPDTVTIDFPEASTTDFQHELPTKTLLREGKMREYMIA